MVLLSPYCALVCILLVSQLIIARPPRPRTYIAPLPPLPTPKQVQTWLLKDLIRYFYQAWNHSDTSGIFHGLMDTHEDLKGLLYDDEHSEKLAKYLANIRRKDNPIPGELNLFTRFLESHLIYHRASKTTMGAVAKIWKSSKRTKANKKQRDKLAQCSPEEQQQRREATRQKSNQLTALRQQLYLEGKLKPLGDLMIEDGIPFFTSPELLEEETRRYRHLYGDGRGGFMAFKRFLQSRDPDGRPLFPRDTVNKALSLRVLYDNEQIKQKQISERPNRKTKKRTSKYLVVAGQSSPIQDNLATTANLPHSTAMLSGSNQVSDGPTNLQVYESVPWSEPGEQEYEFEGNDVQQPYYQSYGYPTPQYLEIPRLVPAQGPQITGGQQGVDLGQVASPSLRYEPWPPQESPWHQQTRTIYDQYCQQLFPETYAHAGSSSQPIIPSYETQHASSSAVQNYEYLPKETRRHLGILSPHKSATPHSQPEVENPFSGSLF